MLYVQTLPADGRGDLDGNIYGQWRDLNLQGLGIAGDVQEMGASFESGDGDLASTVGGPSFWPKGIGEGAGRAVEGDRFSNGGIAGGLVEVDDNGAAGGGYGKDDGVGVFVGNLEANGRGEPDVVEGGLHKVFAWGETGEGETPIEVSGGLYAQEGAEEAFVLAGCEDVDGAGAFSGGNASNGDLATESDGGREDEAEELGWFFGKGEDGCATGAREEGDEGC